MTVGDWSFGGSLLVTLFWVGLALDPRRRWGRAFWLDRHLASNAPESVLALVPARDEAEHLPISLEGLATQELCGSLDLVVVDDGSTDATAAVAERELTARAAAGSLARWQVVRAPEKLAGWSGKVHAQAAGFDWARENWYRQQEVPPPDREGRGVAEGQAAGGVDAGGVAARALPEWLLLCDADIRLRRDALADLLATARNRNRDLVSVMARLRCDGFWERLLVPPFVFFFQLLYPFRLVADDRSPVAAAAGGCLLVRLGMFERAGGFAAISGALIDDVGLAKIIGRAGGRLWLGIDAGVTSLRPYRTLRSLWLMVARSAFVQLRHSWLLLLAVVVGLGWFFVLPPAGAVSALWLGTAREDTQLLATGALLAAAWAMQCVLLRPVAAHHRAGWLFATTLWLAAALYAAMTISSAWSHLRGRTAPWKGREYR
jgi:hopene-associated glycosyltransferase HpnB